MALVVPLPPPGVVRIRVCTSDQIGSWEIRVATGGPWSHSEAVEDKLHGGCIIAAQTSYVEGTPDPGVRRFKIDYDTWSVKQAFIDIVATPEQYAAWINFLWDQSGKPFDHISFFGFAIPFLDIHEKGAWVCSAVQIAACREAGLPAPEIDATYKISPNSLWRFYTDLKDSRVTIHGSA